jgi:predicted TIM-barrel enzyme
VWVDNAGIDEMADEQTQAERTAAAQAKSGWQGLYFGGVAFKYQRPVANLARAAVLATRYMDVVTTSGSGTGQAAHQEKIRTMKQAVGDFPLAIASGITPENVHRYLGLADCFLVATGISSSWSELDPRRVASLVSAARSR